MKINSLENGEGVTIETKAYSMNDCEWIVMKFSSGEMIITGQVRIWDANTNDNIEFPLPETFVSPRYDGGAEAFLMTVGISYNVDDNYYQDLWNDGILVDCSGKKVEIFIISTQSGISSEISGTVRVTLFGRWKEYDNYVIDA